MKATSKQRSTSEAAHLTNPLHHVAVVQVRLGSTRLPGKALALIDGEPMLWHVIQRLKSSQWINEIVVATTLQAEDDAIEKFCRKQNLKCFRGSVDDVLDRFYQAAKQSGADVITRVTADCPMLDSQVIDKVISAFHDSDCDYASNVDRYTYPDGLDTEVFSFKALERAWKEAKKPSDREHVTPYLRNTGLFRKASIENETDLSVHQYHWSVDKPQDLEFARKVITSFKGKEFHLNDILRLLAKKPDLKLINAEQVTNEGYYRSLYQQAKTTGVAKLKITKSEKLLKRSKAVIPGCSQTFSKAYNQYVEGASPIFLERGDGCRVWDVDGNEYIDYVQGLLANILGYNRKEVNEAVMAVLKNGHSFSLPHRLEVELAEKLCELIPCAEMVRFGKNGSDVTSGAVRAARAFTGRERIACSGYHGWQDWFIGSTTRNAGVPKSVCQLTHPFPYNNLERLKELFEMHPGEFAAVIMEPRNFIDPEPGFLEGVKKLAHAHGALLIFDEICTGFRFGMGGAQELLGVTPDLACFGKGVGNGFPISCVVGSKKIMPIFEEIFFSFTLAGEVSSMAAALKVIEILETTDTLVKMEAMGRQLQDGFNTMSREAGLENRFKCIGKPIWSLLKFLDEGGKDSFLERSLFQQEAVKRGLLVLVTHNISGAHDSIAIEKTLEAYGSIFKTLKGWLSDKNPGKYLEGNMVQAVFKVR